jgi:hypothetical protein
LTSTACRCCTSTWTFTCAPTLASSAAEREEWGKQGESQIRAIVKQMNLREAMDNLKKHDEFTNKVLMPKFGKILPGAHQ